MQDHHYASQLDTVVRWCKWTDGGAEFVFHDGTVFSFCNSMDTFVALRPNGESAGGLKDSTNVSTGATPAGAPAAGIPGAKRKKSAEPNRQLFITSMTLSFDMRKVTNALELFNRVSERPKLILGLLPAARQQSTATSKSPTSREVVDVDVQVWNQHTPIDSLIVKCDQSLLEATQSGGWKFSCALKHTVMELPANQRTFTVKWPAVVLSPDGSRSNFAPSSTHIPTPFSEESHSATTHHRTFNPQSFRYTLLEQTFSSANPPVAWQSMLDVMFELIAQRNDQRDAAGAGQDEEDGTTKTREVMTLVGTLPETLPTVLGGGGTAMSPTRAGPSVLYSGGATVKFSVAAEGDTHPLAAEPLLFPARCMDRIHPPKTTRTYDTSDLGLNSSATGTGHPPAVGSSRSSSSVSVVPATAGAGGVASSRGADLWESAVPQVDYYFDVSLGEIRVFPFTLHHLSNASESSSASASSVTALANLEVTVGEDGSFLQLIPNGSAFKANHVTLFPQSTNTMTTTTNASAQDLDQGILTPKTTVAVEVQEAEAPPAPLFQALDPVTDFVSKEYHIDGTATGSVGIGQQLLPTLVGVKLDDNLSRGRYLTAVCNAAVSLCRVNVRRTTTPSDLQARLLGLTTAGIGQSQQHSTAYLGGPDYSTGGMRPNVSDAVAGGSGVDFSGLSLNNHSTTAALPTSPTGGLGEGPVQVEPGTVGLVKCSTRVESVGVFTAYHDGTVRAVFDDRTIVTLKPDNFGTAEGLVCTTLAADASLSTIRVVQCRANHPAHPYLMYVLPFYDFSKLEKRDQLAFRGSGEPSGMPQQIPPAAGAGPVMAAHSDHVARAQFRPSGVDLDTLLYQTRGRLKASEQSSQRTRELLQHGMEGGSVL